MRTKVLLMALVVAGCGRDGAARTALTDSTRAVVVEPGTVAGAVALQLWELRPGVTLAQWKAAHPDEAVSGEDSAGAGAWLGSWCVAAQKLLPVGTRAVTRTALFYPPPPLDLALPDSAGDLISQCVLGAILEQAANGAAATGPVADSLERALASAWGPPVHGTVRAAGAALWARPARFRRADVDLLAGVRGPTIEALALLPIAGVSLDSAQPLRASIADTLPLDSVVAGAKLDTAAYRALRQLDAARTPAVMRPSDLAAALARWVALGAALPAPRRAAALYVADRILDRDLCAYRLCDDQGADARGRLAVAGARFTMFDDGWAYDRNWLAQARALDRDSPLGQQVLLEQLDHGFRFGGTCPAGGETFRRVIDEGERYLARVPAAPIAPRVHYLLGEAYGDIVALAHGAGGLDADTSRYGAEAVSAAGKALAHYRTAMRNGPRDPVAIAAWRKAWWLKAGLAPRALRFYCVDRSA